jgi:hypothetical protein
MRRVFKVLGPIVAALALAPAALGATQSVNIPNTTIPNDGQVHVIGTVALSQITQVNVTPGQAANAEVSNFALHTTARPSSYPAVGTIGVNVTDQQGNGLQVTVTYTGKNAQGFTGCNITSGDVAGLTTSGGPAQPLITGEVDVNRTGVAGHPWLNTLTTSTAISVDIQSSNDGGVTWNDEAGYNTTGGVFTNRFGQTVSVDSLLVGPVDPGADHVRMTALVTGPSSVFLSGTASVLTR